jgi:adenylate kinase
MILVLLGPPGAGKGTQGIRIVERCGVPKISTGEIFRDLAAAGTPLGLEARNYWSQGKLVPDEVVVGLVRERISCDDCREGFILDGFPRTVIQADILDDLLTRMGRKIDGVLDFAVDAEELVHRLAGRRTCPNCSATYHLTSKPPRVDGHCDHCGCPLVQRSDDNPESIRIRLQEYAAKTAPLLAYYAERGLLHRIDSNGTPDEIFAALEPALLKMGCAD